MRYTVDAITGVVTVTDQPSEGFPPIDIPAPEPTLDERVEKVEAEVATTQEVLDVLFGGA